MNLSAEQKEIYDFLLTRKQTFVSANEVSKWLGGNKRYQSDRTWARPILRRMEMEGILESNPFGEYRICVWESQTSFFEAMSVPGADLGDTTIIRIEDVRESEKE